MAVRRYLVLVMLVVVAACGGAATSAPAGTSTAAPTTRPTASPATTTPRPSPMLLPGVSMTLPLGELTYGIAGAGDAIWVEGNGRILQLDAVTGEERQSLSGSQPRVAGDALWYVKAAG